MITALQKRSGDVIVSLCIQIVSMKSMTLKICCTGHCSDLTEDTFASGKFQCIIYFATKKKKEKLCVFFFFLEGKSIILKYTFTSVVHQLASISMDLSANYRRVESGTVCRHLIICEFAYKSSECQLEIVLTMFHRLPRKQCSTLFLT